MLRSMTGYGKGRLEAGGLAVTVEIKSVNSRFLKVSPKLPSLLTSREQEFEKLIKRSVRRGAVTITVILHQKITPRGTRLNEDLIREYQKTFRELGLPEDRIVTLPGVLQSVEEEAFSDESWKTVQGAVSQALEALVSMREREGMALKPFLLQLLEGVKLRHLNIVKRSPAVVEEYQKKLGHRIEKLLQHAEAESIDLEPAQLAREVAIFADKSDITEELDRLEAHFAQAQTLLTEGGEVGRPLEFIAQEIHREFNTIGSKASDKDISADVIGAKIDLEKFKEQVANIE